MVAINLLILHWFSSLFCQSFFLHRYASHNMFHMNRFWEKVFYLLTYLSQGASFLNPRTYAILHNRHHQFSDGPNDPHSPYQSKNIVKMMLRTYSEYMEILNDEESKKSHQYPKWQRLDDFAESYWNILLWIIIYYSIYVYFEIPTIYYILLPLHFIIGPIQGAIVNWFGHKIGYVNFKLPDQSKNSLPIDFLLMGELYQNNHHKHAKRLNFSHRFFEIDLTYILATILLQLGIIKLQRNSNEVFHPSHSHSIQ